MSDHPKSAVVLGARNLGGAIVAHLLAEGWRVAGVTRSEDTLARLDELAPLALRADASDPAGSPRRWPRRARSRAGSTSSSTR